ncbi:tenascin-X precursor [Pelomyxa schiedti]|nr:tenascin-X precursor [Pelomyxa schiedti]
MVCRLRRTRVILAALLAFVICRCAADYTLYPTIFLEAEYPTYTGTGWEVISQEQFNSCGLILRANAESDEAGNWATYIFNVPSTGTYWLWARVQSVMSGSITFQGCNVQVDTNAIFSWSMGWPPLFSSSYMEYPHGWRRATSYTFTTTGPHNLTITTRMKYATIDKFMFTQDGTSTAPPYFDLGYTAINIPTGKCQTAYFEAEYGDTTGLSIIGAPDASKEGAIYKTANVSVCTTSTSGTAVRFNLNFSDPSVYRAVWLRLLAPSTSANEAYIINTGSCSSALVLAALPSPEFQWVRLYKPVSVDNEFHLIISPKEPYLYIDKVFIGYAGNPSDSVDAPIPDAPSSCTKNGLCDPVTSCTYTTSVTCSACPTLGYSGGCALLSTPSCQPDGCKRIVPFGCFYDRTAALSALSDSLPFPTSALTVEMWMQPMLEMLTKDHTVFSYVSNKPNFSELHIRYNPTTGLFLKINGIAFRPTTNVYLTKKNMWYHVSVTWDIDGKTVKLYLNNLLKHTWHYTGTVTFYSPGVISLGKPISYGKSFTYSDGSEPSFSIDELHIWNKVLDSSEWTPYQSAPITVAVANLLYSFSFGTAVDTFSVSVPVCPAITSDTFLPYKITLRPSEAVALRNLYYSMGGASWGVNVNWLYDKPCNGSSPVWFGIDCNSNGRVSAINLPYNNLVGKFPEFYDQKFFTSLTSLDLLILSENSISGPVPDDIGFLESVTSIFAYGNKLTALPSTFSKLTNLTQLFLQDNLLSGSVPEMFATMEELTYLYLSDNALTGSVPVSLADSNIKFLDLSNNQLSGTLPEEIVSSQIYYMDLSNNQLSGLIPDRTPQDDSNMIQMDLGGNSFRCMLPPFMRLDTLKFKIDVQGTIFFCPTNEISAAVVNEACESVFINSITPSDWNVSKGFDHVVATLNVSSVHKCAGVVVEFLGLGLVKPFSVAEDEIKIYLPEAPTAAYPLRIKWLGDFYNDTYISSNMVDITYWKPCPDNCVKPYGVCMGISGICQCNTTWDGPDCHSKACPGNCNSHGVCDGLTGKCNCTDPWFGVSCNAARQDCAALNYCSGTGQCDIYKGTCSCYLGYWGDDCSNKTCPPYKKPFCNHGWCNGTAGTCVCTSGWAGDACDKPAKPCPANCTNEVQGSCDLVSGTCVCYQVGSIKWGGPNCSEAVCLPACVSGQGSCENSTCKCAAGYQGADCGVLHIPCLNNCTDQGSCDYRFGNCTCEYGFRGEDCSLFVCAGTPECNSPHGTCNQTDGTCLCQDDRGTTGEYYTGFRCQYQNFQCPGTPTCSGHGFCDKSDGICTCSYPYDWASATDCSIALCPKNCSYPQGVCDRSTGKCACTSEYNTTQDCSYKHIDCPASCNHGYCDYMVGECKCDVGYGDATNTTYCDFLLCPANCNGQGACINGSCDCITGWSGSSCAISNVSCPDNCNAPNGYCTTDGECFCYGTFYGPACADKSCYSGCSGHGLCDTVTGTCTCDPGFELPDCYINLCSLNDYCTSNKRGTCDSLSGTCNCISPYWGSSCENIWCPSNCTGHGNCSYETGVCTCEDVYIGTACETFSVACPPDRMNECNGNGKCDNTVGVCDCQSGFFGTECNQRWCPNNCSDHGTCNYATGECTCNVGWNEPTDITCSVRYVDCLEPNCTGNGFCNKYIETAGHGTCYCYSGYYGDSCEFKSCPPRCDEHGTCESNGTCTCDQYWNGTACLEPTKPCPGDCYTPHGTCNHVSGNCTCAIPYELPYCQYAPCYLDCSGHGTCIRENGTCTCQQYYSGAGCQIANLPCVPSCTIHGKCDPNTGTCVCSGGFHGTTCNNKTCPGATPCNSKGTCDWSTGTCTCPDPEWQGDACQIPNLPCPGNCTNSTHGLCNAQTGTCSCRYPYFGSSCSNIHCPNQCRGYGTCNNITGVCTCFGRHLPPDCFFSSCPGNCSGHGTCNPFTGLCTCSPYDMWGGDDCNTRLCPMDCSGSGTCKSSGKCDCKIGTTGDGCQKENWWIIVVCACGGSLILVGGAFGAFMAIRQFRISQATKRKIANQGKYSSAEMAPSGH